MSTILRVRSGAAARLVVAGAVLIGAVAVAVPATAVAAPSVYSLTAPVPIPHATGAAGVNSVTNTVYLGTSTAVVVVDGATNRVTARVAVSAPVTAIEVNSVTNTVYVGTQADQVLALSGQSKQTTATIAVPGLNSAAGTGRLAVDTGTNKVYVGTWTTAASVIDGATNTVTARIPYGAGDTGTGGVAVDTATHSVYATTPDHLLAISGTSHTVTGTATIAGLRPGAYATGSDIVVDPTTHVVYASHHQDGESHVNPVNGATLVGRGSASGPAPKLWQLAIDPGTHTLYETNVPPRAVLAVEVDGRGFMSGGEIIPTDTDPLAVAVNPTTHAAYVLGRGTNNTGELNIINGPAGPRFCPAVYGAIGDKYRELGGCDGVLGKATSPEVNSQASRVTHFEGGDIYYTPRSGAHAIMGAIEDRWQSLHAELSILGMPITDELTTPDGIGRYNHFEHGSIYYSPATGAHEVYGAIGERWADEGFERSPYGYPTGAEFSVGGGLLFGPYPIYVQFFERGIILWQKQYGYFTFHW